MPTGVSVTVSPALGGYAPSAGALLSSPTVVAMNTTATNDMGADGFTWAQGGPEVIDKFGKIVSWAQRNNGGTKRHVIVTSGDNGATWSEPTRTGFFDAAGEGFMFRGASAYDGTHDLLHVCWVLAQVDGAVVYRQYSFTRDGSNNVTGVTRVRGFQPETGVAGMTFEAPVCRYLSDVDKVLIGWSARNATLAEYRFTMAPIVNGAADTTAATWVAPFNEAAGAGATDTLGSTGLVKYSCPAKSATAMDLFLAVCRKSATATTHAKDLYWANTTGGATGKIVWNRATWSAANSDFRGGLGAVIANDSGVSTISNIQVAGTDAGYSLKFQLISKLVEDTQNDKLWVAMCVWKDDTDGDSWTLWSISTADAVSSPIYAYRAGSANTDGARDIFVTGDVMYDATSKYVVVSYTDLMRHDCYLSTYANGVAVQTAFLVYNTTPVDIPTVYDVRINGTKIGVLFRDFNPEARTNPPVYGAEQQTIAISGTPTGGTYTVTYNGNTSGAIAFNANAATVQAALRLVAGLGSVVVSSTGVSPNFTHRVIMYGILSDPPQMTSTSSLTGGTPAIAHATPNPWVAYRGYYVEVVLA